MSADIKREPQSTIIRLVLTVAGALLMVGAPFTFEVLNLTSRLQSTTVAAVELVLLVVGLMLLYLAFRGKESAD
jgi:protein-S-isoprenylcysteine O-methyltransferase Ste14